MVRGIRPKGSPIYYLIGSLLFMITGLIFESLPLISLSIITFFYSAFLVILRKRQMAVVPMPHEKYRAQATIIVGYVIFLLLALKLTGVI